MPLDKLKEAGRPIPHGASFSQYARGDEIPENAVLMTDNDMMGVVYRTIAKWKPRSEMWPFTYGTGILGGAAAVTGAILNAHLRNKFRLGNFAQLLTFAPTCIIPTITTVMVQETMITRKQILREFDCPACAQIRSSALMVSTGLIQPCLLALFSCSVIAKTRYTISLPPINSRRILTTYANMLKPAKITILGLFLMNVAVGIYFTEQREHCVMKVHERMSKGL